MAVDITDETKQQYRDRLKTLETKVLLSSYNTYTDFGYNCEGLVTADGVIVPRWKYIEEELRARGEKVTPFGEQ